MPFLTELDTRYIGNGRNRLRGDLIYEYLPAKVVIAEKNFVTDFASIPRLFRAIITGQDNTKRGAVIHDYLYLFQPEGVTRRYADGIMLMAMLEGPDEMRVSKWKAYMVYYGVRMGGWVAWNRYKK
tara:strand:- start:3472 stop:3849 length:378 start_codon:yes stop_codon:yes gene_type:complete